MTRIEEILVDLEAKSPEGHVIARYIEDQLDFADEPLKQARKMADIFLDHSSWLFHELQKLKTGEI
jgi:hypothetical protein